MNRRQSLLALSAVAGHALFPEVLARFARVAASDAAWTPEALRDAQGALLAAAADTIIPDTDTPGARAARVHVFVDLVLAHCRTPAEREAFVKGLDALDGESRAQHGAPFATAPQAAREAILLRLEAAGDPFLRGLKELTVLGYCTSEIGATRALAYDAVPGAYHGCVPLKPGQKGWATS